ncbi:hypothetical protein [Rhizobium leguminosarum]|uniref:hypothetical protein n=1 Tax=Rhizobium leguminosarum TaxID=384 RepID=UPI001442438B|nr:hypothetical protein [Rhizobium leguminosarum]
MQDQGGKAGHRPALPEGGKRFGDGERSHLVESGENRHAVTERASIEAVAEQVFCVEKPVAVDEIAHGDRAVCVCCPRDGKLDPFGRPRCAFGDIDDEGSVVRPRDDEVTE